MFKFIPGETITYNNQKYKIVEDFVSLKLTSLEESSFVSHSTLINDQEHYFINTYSDGGGNEIGFWQTILANHNFDYKEDFKYQFNIDEKIFFISYSLDGGLVIEINTAIIEKEQFELITIDFDSFTRFSVIKTDAQKQAKKSKALQRILLKIVAFWVLIGAFAFGYFEYKLGNFNDREKTLTGLQSTIQVLKEDIRVIISNSIDNDVHYQQGHVMHLFHLISKDVKILNSNFNMSNASGEVTIGFDDINIAEYIIESQKFQTGAKDIKITGDFKKGSAKISWDIESGK